MKIEAEKITNAALMRLACEATMHGDVKILGPRAVERKRRLA